MSVVAIQRRRDPEATRTAILEAAEELFVQRGFAATSMSDIAARANVTKSLIHHHFGPKDELWSAVKKYRLDEYAEAQQKLAAEGPYDEALFRKSVETYFEFLKKNPEFIRLYTWMSLEEPQLSEAVRPDLMNLGVERLQEAQRYGNFRKDVDAEHVLVLFLSLTMHWFMARNSFTGAGLVDPDPQVSDGAYLDDMLTIFLEGILPRSEASRARESSTATSKVRPFPPAGGAQPNPSPRLDLHLLAGRFAVVRLATHEACPSWALDGPFISVTRTRDELSIVCLEERVPPDLEPEGGWRCLQVAGPLDFAQTGVVAALTAPLADAGIPLLTIATFDTDYLLVKDTQLATAIAALKAAGHTLVDSADSPRR